MVRPIYRLYERRLLHQLRSGPMPRHIGVILDGNRRFARQQGVTDARAIYELGARKLDDVLDWCAELAIPAVTLWVFSTDNLDRRPDEVGGILGAIETKLRALADDPQIHRRRVRVRAIGNIGVLPEPTAAAIRAACDATARYDAMTLTIAVAYGGREEIAHAVRALLATEAEKGEPCGSHRTGDPRGDRRASLHRRIARSRSHHPDERRDPALRLPAMAERLQRVLLLGRLLARLPQGRLPSRAEIVPAPRTPLREIGPAPFRRGLRSLAGVQPGGSSLRFRIVRFLPRLRGMSLARLILGRPLANGEQNERKIGARGKVG